MPHQTRASHCKRPLLPCLRIAPPCHGDDDATNSGAATAMMSHGDDAGAGRGFRGGLSGAYELSARSDTPWAPSLQPLG
jgi:hypothetical protein